MEMTSTRSVPAPVATVWAALNDPAMLKDCIPGCETIEPDGENAYRIALAARVGPVAAKFSRPDAARRHRSAATATR